MGGIQEDVHSRRGRGGSWLCRRGHSWHYGSAAQRPVTCCFGGTERELSECLGRARMRTWVSWFSVNVLASIALPWVDSDHVTLCPNPYLGDALSLALKALTDLA